MFNSKLLIFVICFSFLVVSCDSVNSQDTNSNDRNLNININIEKGEIPSDDYDLSKAGAEELNKQPLPKTNPEIINKPFPREKIREALISNKLIGDSLNGEIGGYKIVHFSHVCNLSVENEAFYVVKIDSILQQASVARADSRTLIFDKSFKLIHNLSASDPLFCEGNRLFFNNYTMTTFYGEPEKEVKGNVLIFSDKAKNIEGKMANLNFYKIKDLIR